MSSGALQAWECFPFLADIIFGEFRIVLLIDDLQGDLRGRPYETSSPPAAGSTGAVRSPMKAWAGDIVFPFSLDSL